MKTFLAELLMVIAFRVADSASLRGDNIRWSLWQYFVRFRDAPRASWQGELHHIPVDALWR